MSNLTQEQIDRFIQFIDAAEDPGVITNAIVAAVLAYLADKVKSMAIANDLNVEASARAAADAALQNSIQSEATARAAADTSMSAKIAELETALDNLTENITPETLEALAEAIAFLDGIGDDATLAAQLAGINSRLGDVETGLAGKAGVDASTGRLTYSQMPHLVLASMGSDLDGEQTILGDLLDCYVYIQSSRKIYYNKANGDQVAGVTPDKGFVYCNAITRKQYIWTGDQDKPWREIDPEPRTIVSEVSATYRTTPPDGLNDYWYIFRDPLVTKLIHLYKIGTRVVEERLDLDSRVLYYSVSNEAWYRLDGSNLVRVNVYVKPATGIPASDLEDGVIPNVSSFATKTELRSKANDNEVVKSISVNGGPAQTPDNGNVNISVSGIKGDKGDKGDTGNVQVDGNGNVLIYNGRDMTAPGAALDASQGQFLGKLFNVNDNTFYKVWVGTQQQLEALNGDYDEDTIYIVGTVPGAVTRYSINKSGIGQHITVGGDNANDTSVREGYPFSVTVSPESGYTIDSATGDMAGGGTLTKTENQDHSVTFSTTAVTGAISITAVATVHIDRIDIAQGTRVVNDIPLTATVNPLNADNVTLEWSIDNTNDFNITDNGNGTATLTVKEGADNASVTVTCKDINSDSGKAQGTLQLTGLSYEDTPIPTMAITDITASRTSANTLGLTLVKTPANSNSVINYSLANVPYVMRLDSNGDPTYHPAATINSSTGEITYKAAAVYYAYDSVNDEYNYIPASGYDFALDVVATRSDDNTVTKTQTIQVTHNSGDVMWFEDLNVLRFIKNSATTDTPTEDYTFANAASRAAFKPSATYKPLIERFIEFKYFGSTNLGPNATNHATFNNCSKLKCLGIPSGITKFETSLASASPVYGCPLKEVHFANIGNYCGVDHKFNDTDTFNGSFGTASIDEALGLGLYIDGEDKTELVIPSSVAVIKQFAFSGFNHITKLTLNYDGVVSGYNSFTGKNNDDNTANLLKNIDLYVPSGQLASYQSSGYWKTAKSINAIPE